MRSTIRSSIMTIAGCCGVLFGQNPAAVPPLQVNRTPAKKQVPPLLERYDFGEQLRVLETPPSPGIPTRMATDDGQLILTGSSNPDIPLNPTALEAVRVSESWRGDQNPPAAGPDGR